MNKVLIVAAFVAAYGMILAFSGFEITDVAADVSNKHHQQIEEVMNSVD